MNKKTGPAKAKKGDELEKLIKSARAGDVRALAALKEKLGPALPQWYEEIGDLAKAAETSLLDRMVGDDLLAKDALRKKMRELEKELAGPHPTPLEKLLAQRISACWLMLHYSETVYAQNMGNLNIRWAEFHQRRIDRAHRRYLSAIKALAQVRRLLYPSAVQVNVGVKQVNVVQVGAEKAEGAKR